MIRDNGAFVVGACGELLAIPELLFSLGTSVLEISISTLNSEA
jgi:hypothetical protein